MSEINAEAQAPAAEEKPAPKRRGRKPKAEVAAEAASAADAPAKADAAEEAPAPKRRGRKPKAQAEDALETPAEPAEKPKRGRPRKTVAEVAEAADAAEALSAESADSGHGQKSSAESTDSGKTQKKARGTAKAASSAAAPERALTEDEAAALIAQARKEHEAAQAAVSDESATREVDPTAMYPRRRREKPAPVEGEGKRKPRRTVKAEGGAELAPAEANDSARRQKTASEASARASREASSEANDIAAAVAAEATKEDAITLFDVPESEMPKIPEHEAADIRPGRANREERTSRGEREHRANDADRDKGDKKKQNDRTDRNDRNARNNRNENNGRNDRNDRSNRNDRNHNRNNKNNRNNRNREVEPSVTREGLAELKVADLRAKAAELSLEVAGMKKAELVEAVYDATLAAEGFLEVSGVLDILADGYGFLRTQGYLPSETDCYVGLSLIKRNGLRKGDYIVGQTRPARSNEKFAAIQHVISVNGTPIDQLGKRVRFADLTPVYPQERLWMEHGKNTITSRVIDLVAPIGKGQRGLIVSPPKAGKTTILKDIAASISANNPEVHLMCLLIDERPEEVTDMERSIKGEVISSTFDMPADNHIACAEMVIERAKRLVENGQDVVILLDSITRLARAYNLAQPASGRVLSGGVDSTALYPPKKFLGAARNIENGGSLTILASALIDTGSKMDEVIFEEFKGTGNMELKLDRNLADRRIFPAIDAVSSGTRKEELLIDPQLSPLIWAVRRILANMNNTERATDTLIKSIKQTENNQEFLLRMARKAQQNSKVDSLDV